MIARIKVASCLCLYLCVLVLSAPSHAAIESSSHQCELGHAQARKCDPLATGTESLESASESQGTSGEASLVLLPSKMDNLYRYNVNSESDIVTFYNKSQKKLQQALTFYNADRRLVITVRDFPSGKWSRPVDIHRQIGDDELEYDSHNSTGLGVASDGTLFVTANQHVDPLRMAMTTRPYDINSFTALPANAINRKDDDRVTYPFFAYLKDDLYFSYREQEAGGGVSSFRWLLKKWNIATQHWDSAAQFNTGHHLRLYVSNLAWNNAGTELHLSALWRDDRAEYRVAGTGLQHDLFHLYSNDGTNWKQYGEGSVELPLLWTDPGKSNVPQLIWNTSVGDPVPANSGSIALDANSYPHILNREKGGPLYYHFHDGEQWTSVKDVFNSMTDDIFQMADGMGAISARKDEIRFHRLSPVLDRKGVLLAKGYITRHFNASVDKTAIAQGWLSMMLTENKHSGVNKEKGSYPTDAFVMNIPLSQLDGFSTPYIRD